VLNLDLAVGGAQRSRQQEDAIIPAAPGEIGDFAAKSRFCTPEKHFTYPCYSATKEKKEYNNEKNDGYHNCCPMYGKSYADF
jgi:hypothetical protein